MGSFFERFRRVTASTDYLPEIDGLRFLAVFWVAIIMHTTHYLDEKLYENQLIKEGPWKWVVLEGTHGMYLFFMISGFILSLPFAKAYLKGEERVNLKRYYLRRLTRLEPPYIIALVIFLLAHVFIVKKYTISQLVPSFLASLIYSHNLIYEGPPLVLPVAWSLEVEVQFYILAPLFCLLFKIRKVLLRRFLLVLIIVCSLLMLPYIQTPNLLQFIHHFFSGLLLADLYVSQKRVPQHATRGFLLGILALVALLSIPSYYWLPMLFLKLSLLFIVFYQTLFNARMKAMFSPKGMVLIGGMCYSLYLLHFGIISCFGSILLSQNKSFNYNHAPLYLIAITLLILFISAGFYYFIEKPFMKYKLKYVVQKEVKTTSI